MAFNAGPSHNPQPVPLEGAELTARGRPEDSEQGVVVLRKKRKYLLNKTKHVSVPFFRLC